MSTRPTPLPASTLRLSDRRTYGGIAGSLSGPRATWPRWAHSSAPAASAHQPLGRGRRRSRALHSPELMPGKTRGKKVSVKVVKVTSNGQVTIPVEAREKLRIGADTYLEVSVEGSSVRFRKRPTVRPLGDDDPIWDLVGIGRSGSSDVSHDHDRYLAEGERRRWRESS